MVRATVILTFLFLACTCAVPVPGNPKFTLVKDSSLGVGAATAGGKTGGVVEGNKSIEAPLPGKTGDSVPEVTVFENVNAGAAFADGGSISSGVVKNNYFKGKNPFTP